MEKCGGKSCGSFAPTHPGGFINSNKEINDGGGGGYKRKEKKEAKLTSFIGCKKEKEEEEETRLFVVRRHLPVRRGAEVNCAGDRALYN